MLKNRIVIWLLVKLQNSNNALLRKIGNSLKRDQDLPFAQLIRKSVIFFKAMITSRFNLRKCNKVGKRPRTRRRPYIENAGKIVIGNDININSKNVQTDFVTGPNGLIEIGDEVSINFGVSIVAEKKIKIGNRIRIGPYTMIFDTDRHVTGDRYKWAGGEPVVIEDDVWLATRVLVLKGSLIGKGSVIAGGSVVSGVIPPYVVAGGIPARVIKFLKTPESETDFSWDRDSGKEGYSADISQRVGKVFQRVFPHIEQMEQNPRPATTDGWDSITHVRLIREIEQEFGLTFRMKDWNSLSNLEKICRKIQKYQYKTKAPGEHFSSVK